MADLLCGIRNIVALDGGGLYGLTSALWLKQLCQRDPKFLAGDDAQLFAGCSAGALNALLIAREKDPRDFILRGGLEEFWRQPGTFSNSNPVTAVLSLYQITAWLGAEDFLHLLRREFGELTLGDLRPYVLITAFNWTGDRSCGAAAPRWPSPPGCDPLNPWPAWPWGVSPSGCPPGVNPLAPWAEAMGAPAGGAPPGPADLLGGTGPDVRGWRPKFFKNFPHSEPDRTCSVVDVAYAAASPPGLRAVLNGFGDGGTVTACPVADAVAAVIAEERRLRDIQHNASPQEFDCIRDVLSTIRALSVGVGAKTTSYWLRFIDQSFTQFSLYPTNPLTGNWYPPSVSIGLDAPTEEALYIARQLLSVHFHRLDAGLLDVPTLVACIWSRFPMVRQWLAQQIYSGVETPASRAAVEETLIFLRESWHSLADAEAA